MAQTQFFPIVSSNLHAAAYDRDWKELVVRFKSGTAYKYQDVPASLWSEFKKLFDGKRGSAGSFFAKHIKIFASERIEDWQ